MRVRGMTKPDFDYVVQVLDRWWGGPARQRAQAVFFYELGEHALIAEDDSGEIIGFLFGFHTPDKSTGYVHLVGIHPDHRRKRVGQALYEQFTEGARKAGCKALKATTAVGNEGSVRFHVAQGWTMNEIEDYAGPGRLRIVFTKALTHD